MWTAHKGKIAFSDGVHWIYKPHLGQPPLPAVDSQQEMTAIILLEIFVSNALFGFFLPYLSFALILQYSVLCFYGFHVSLCVTVYVFLLFILSSVLFIDVFAFFCLCLLLLVSCFLCSFVCLVLVFGIVFSCFLPKEKERRLKVGWVWRWVGSERRWRKREP